MRKLIFCSLGLILCLATSMAQAYRLQYNDTQGSEHEYKLLENNTYATDNGTMDWQFTLERVMGITQQVKQVQGSGAAICETQNGELKFTLTKHTGLVTPQPSRIIPWVNRKLCFQRSPAGDITHPVDPDVKFSSQQAEMYAQFDYLGLELHFPNTDVKIGDKWTCDIPIPFGSDQYLKIAAHYTLVGEQWVGANKLLKITSTYSMNISKRDLPDTWQFKGQQISITLNGTATSFFDPQAGALYQSIFTINYLTDTIYVDSGRRLMKNENCISGSMNYKDSSQLGLTSTNN